MRTAYCNTLPGHLLSSRLPKLRAKRIIAKLQHVIECFPPHKDGLLVSSSGLQACCSE